MTAWALLLLFGGYFQSVLAHQYSSSHNMTNISQLRICRASTHENYQPQPASAYPAAETSQTLVSDPNWQNRNNTFFFHPSSFSFILLTWREKWPLPLCLSSTTLRSGIPFCQLSPPSLLQCKWSHLTDLCTHLSIANWVQERLVHFSVSRKDM